ncbi:hypothetical protein GALMADRAFT_250753 [Galerina marginata CBS 339.88]|uniref:Galactose oxidase n=1 Tax=Galerina marginata (strain CBS 339.88) TaxID=685588 RepID=A0A067SVF8_GALM3|nr:hypothetical protein GALMADRAFT_250753 [Galerina marginata CBS 339.88]
MDATTPTQQAASSGRNLTLTNVPEEEARSVPSSPSPYGTSSAANSTTTFTTSTTSRPAKKAASVRTLGRSSNDQLASASASGSTSVRRAASTSSTVALASGSSRATRSSASAAPPIPLNKTKTGPKLPHDKDVELAPSTIMYWSRAPVWGSVPTRTMRAHTVTLVDSTAWLFGGCDDKDGSKDIYCFDTETMQWTHPDTVGDIPPPCRAHTATLCERKLIIFGGGLGSIYYDAVYVLDTSNRRWTRPYLAPGPRPPARRAHSAVYYKGKVWVFGGGTGLTALNDVWTLDVAGGAGTASKPMRWEEIETTSKRPVPRGYHTANLVGNIMVIIGGSDGKESFTDVWCLNLDTLVWSLVKQQIPFHKRLAHTATQVGSYIFIMGGHNASEYVSELLLYNLVSLQYEPRLVLGKPPSSRGYHATILADSRLFVFGGFNGQAAFDDVYILDLAAGAYLPQVTSFTMEAL